MRALCCILLLSLPAYAGRRAEPEPELQATAAALLGAALASGEAYAELRVLSDDIGHRISGSPQLARAVTWAEAELRADGLQVALEPVDVPVWERGLGHAEVRAPLVEPLPVLALGGSVATPEGGVEAPVLVVSSFDDLRARAGEAEGRIVVWDVPFTTYGDTVVYRRDGASEAARVGAVASLVRSVTPTSLRTPHTGMQRYAPEVPHIPAAAISTEDAARLHRWQAAGVTPRVHLELRPVDRGMGPSHNVVGEIRGRSLPEEVVVIGCHLDSWDVGQGAQDDGAGCVTVMEAAALLRALPVPPRRTVRVVLFTNEESGLQGGRTYAKVHAGERIVAALEDDTGSGTPLGFRFHTRGEAPNEGALSAWRAALGPALGLLEAVGAGHLDHGYSGADIGPLVAQGTTGFGLDHDETGYWPIHHTEADTFDKVDPLLVRRNVAAVTVLTWALAELPSLPPAAP